MGYVHMVHILRGITPCCFQDTVNLLYRSYTGMIEDAVVVLMSDSHGSFHNQPADRLAGKMGVNADITRGEAYYSGCISSIKHT